MQPFFVLGHPVAHSKSPVMHNAAYRALGLPWEYGLADCATESEARAFLASDSWLGLNVTTPYKPLALEVATRCTAAAIIAQGANVLVRCDGCDAREVCDVRRGSDGELLVNSADAPAATEATNLLLRHAGCDAREGCDARRDDGGSRDEGDGVKLLADSTDGAGCVAFLRRSGIALEGARAVVCGTGPTSLSIMPPIQQPMPACSQIRLMSREFWMPPTRAGLMLM